MRIPLPPLRFIDKIFPICFNLSMDPTAQAYKDKITERIAKIIEESLSKKVITLEQAQQIAPYVLENIDLAKTNNELFEFVTNLSAKWSIFGSILTAPDQAQAPSVAASAVQEKTDQIIQATENLLKENKIDEALQVAKTGTGPSNQNPQSGVGGKI
jgi:hypothetical protein